MLLTRQFCRRIKTTRLASTRSRKLTFLTRRTMATTGPPVLAADADTAHSTPATATPLPSDPETPLVASTPSSSPAPASTTAAAVKPSASIGAAMSIEQSGAAGEQQSVSVASKADVKMGTLPPRETAVVGPFTLPGTVQSTGNGVTAVDGKRARTPTEQTGGDPSSSVAPVANGGADKADAAPPKKKRKPAVPKVYCHQGASSVSPLLLLDTVVEFRFASPGRPLGARAQQSPPLYRHEARAEDEGDAGRRDPDEAVLGELLRAVSVESVRFEAVAALSGALFRSAMLMLVVLHLLARSYNENMQELLSSGASKTWTCPSCRGLCTCAACRNKREPKPEKVVEKPKENGVGMLGEMVPSGGRSAAVSSTSRLSFLS